MVTNVEKAAQAKEMRATAMVAQDLKHEEFERVLQEKIDAGEMTHKEMKEAIVTRRQAVEQANKLGPF